MAGVIIIAKLKIMPVSEVEAQTLKLQAPIARTAWLLEVSLFSFIQSVRVNRGQV
jgi:hypothetical protein